MKIICWNVNSVAARFEALTQLIEQENPDVILLQETKCINEKFALLPLFDLGYNMYHHGQKSYNGVAILSKLPVEDVRYDMPFSEGQARYIEGWIPYDEQMIKVASVYVPNGSVVGSDKFQYKMRFFEGLHQHLAEGLKRREPLIIGGDFNVAPEKIDVYDAKYLDGKIGFHIDERKHFRRYCELGYIDTYRLLQPDSHQYSWWDYRTRGFETGKGMRIDHILASPDMATHLKQASVLAHYRGLIRPSDHAPITVII